MGIEYLSGIKPGDKIDLSRFKKSERNFRPEAFLNKLKEQLAGLAEEVNQEFSGLLDTNGQMTMFGQSASGDSDLVGQQEAAFAAGAGKNLADWRRSKESNPASLTEMALTLILDKFLKDDFIVARASAYDDYNNGVDQVIIDKKTGAVVCGFDEVITHMSDGASPKKEKKIEEKMLNGGARLKYGATIKEGRLERCSLKNIPAFYLALTKEDLNNALEALAAGEAAGQAENKIFNSLIASLDKQFEIFAVRPDLPAELKANLDKFKDSLEKIKDSLNRTVGLTDKQAGSGPKAAA
ncbi:MAG: hypothetical protein WC545_00125 [Patescibacteria group bacterium]